MFALHQCVQEEYQTYETYDFYKQAVHNLIFHSTQFSILLHFFPVMLFCEYIMP